MKLCLQVESHAAPRWRCVARLPRTHPPSCLPQSAAHACAARIIACRRTRTHTHAHTHAHTHKCALRPRSMDARPHWHRACCETVRLRRADARQVAAKRRLFSFFQKMVSETAYSSTEVECALCVSLRVYTHIERQKARERARERAREEEHLLLLPYQKMGQDDYRRAQVSGELNTSTVCMRVCVRINTHTYAHTHL